MFWLKFDKQELGFKEFKITRQSIKENKGKRIVYVTNREIDRIRGYAFPRYATISEPYRNQVLFENGDSEYIKDIIECGIEI